MSPAVALSLKVIALTIVMFVCFALGSLIIAQPGDAPSPQPAGAVVPPLLAVCFLNTLVLTHIILRSRWGGWRLAATVFLVFFGIATFMSQIESAVFITGLPRGMLPRIVLMGALVAAPFSVLAVLILRRGWAEAAETDSNTRLLMPASQWTWKLAVIVVAYLMLYFAFGYFVAWRNPAVREYYGGVDEGGFVAHMGSVLRHTPWLFPFQALRALCWVAIALPVVRMMTGGWQETAVAIGLLFAVLMTSQLLLPNPYMPEAVRMTHLVETASSNFVFGSLVGWLLARGEPRPI